MKTKISTITLLVLLVISYILSGTPAMWSALLIAVVGIVMVVVLNIEALKSKGLIGKQVAAADVVLVFIFALPIHGATLFWARQGLVLIFALLLVAILTTINLFEKTNK